MTGKLEVLMILCGCLGSISQYFPGSFNGTHFEAVDAVARISDFAKDNYAAQWFYGIPGDQPQINIAWASNWQYCQLVSLQSVFVMRMACTEASRYPPGRRKVGGAQCPSHAQAI